MVESSELRVWMCVVVEELGTVTGGPDDDAAAAGGAAKDAARVSVSSGVRQRRMAAPESKRNNAKWRRRYAEEADS